jgi:hypothetical protein
MNRVLKGNTLHSQFPTLWINCVNFRIPQVLTNGFPSWCFTHYICFSNTYLRRQPILLNGYSDRLWAGWLGFDSWQGQETFLYSSVSRFGSGAHPASYPMDSGGFLSPAVKWPGYGADHSTPSGAEVENGGAIPPLPHTSPWCGA